MLARAERIARKRVLLFTPRGEFPQEDFDSSGLGGEELQRHRSTWEPEDLERRGYRVVVMRGFHGPWNEAFVASFGAARRQSTRCWRSGTRVECCYGVLPTMNLTTRSATSRWSGPS